MSAAVVARALIKRTCAAQGLPPTITDPATLARVAQIIAGTTAQTRNGRPKAAAPTALSTTTTTPASTTKTEGLRVHDTP